MGLLFDIVVVGLMEIGSVMCCVMVNMKVRNKSWASNLSVGLGECDVR